MTFRPATVGTDLNADEFAKTVGSSLIDAEPSKIKLPSPEDRRERIQMFQDLFSNSEGRLPTL
jgi:hypothetical protein